MSLNLAADGNEQLAFITECQKKASFWLWQWRKGKIGRVEIDKRLAQLSEPEQQEVKKWLNHYRNSNN
ncbi:DUF3283 family protein [Vibrio sp. V34_P3A8T189]|uniref:DUF3283 family protein n=1 Tax=unclassified Vibrio TaxID=2614977 RepID=UPI0013731C86|nr:MULTISPECIES: DUF3283 family protein [unclassified Vibrio]NAW78344.1 DUF3283 family protein [Vibrio sp. V33_P6A3T137]NAX01877.1 DUF3283 family protein [Vibrio sp. V34_P3A8T189]NAX08244.1 DUF3283 family protein [Vibrio sp. V40_P2S30T141]